MTFKKLSNKISRELNEKLTAKNLFTRTPFSLRFHVHICKDLFLLYQTVGSLTDSLAAELQTYFLFF
jgi:hypothetical protein